MTNYAFFDVDQTIFPGYTMSSFYLSQPIISRLDSESIYKQDAEIGHLAQSGAITYAETGRRTAKLCASIVRGLSSHQVEQLANDFISNHHLKSFVEPLFSLLHKHKYQIVLVSGSLDFIVKAVAEHARADYYFGTSTELTTDGLYTGQVVSQLDDHSKKTKILRSFHLTQDRVIAFGDSTGDLPMLSLAHHAFIINPHQVELKQLVIDNPNYHLVTEDNIIDAVIKLI